MTPIRDLVANRSGSLLPAMQLVVLLLLSAAYAAAAEQTVGLKIIDPLSLVYDQSDVEEADPRDKMLLVGPRNGSCSAVVIATGVAAGDIRAGLDALKTASGDAIPPSAVQIRYAENPGRDRRQDMTGKHHPVIHFGNHWHRKSYYDILKPEPAADATMVPIWVTVSVPADAAPGTYRGTLKAAGKSVPVELRVCPWQCPAPSEFVTYVSLLQSPETLAAHYDVPLWSDEHFDLIAGSLEFMGKLGNEDVFATVLHETHFGNKGGMVWFRKSGDGYVPDFRLLTRYLDLYEEHVGRPHSLVLYVWDPKNRVQIRGRRRDPRASNTLTVTEATEEGAARLQVPRPGDAGSTQIWGGLMDGVRDLMTERGWSETKIHLGFAHDRRPSRKTTEFFREIAPWAGWAIYTHGRGDARSAGTEKVRMGDMMVNHYELPWIPRRRYDALIARIEGGGIVGGWDSEFLCLSQAREYISEYVPLWHWRSLPEGTVAAGSDTFRGFCRTGVDYWEVDGRSLLNTRDSWAGLYRYWSVKALLAPGKNGPVATTRYEMLREGIQECEARISIEKAIADGSITQELANRYAQLEVERLQVMLKEGGFGRGPDYTGPEADKEIKARLWGYSPQWQDLAGRLFDLAAGVSQLPPSGD